MNAEFYKLLNEFVSFKTISVKDEFKQEMKKCASWIENLLKSKWFTVNMITQDWNPIVVADYNVWAEETWIIYGNYDVVFADKKDWWKEDPFSLYLWKEKIIWRWICNWKWELLMYILWIENLVKTDSLKYNVRFIIEWDRYNWSIWLKKILENSELKADFFVSSMWTSLPDYSIVNNWFRWWFSASLKFKSANIEFDSARFWWFVVNPLSEVVLALSKLYDVHNRITIPYFYYDVVEITANEKTINWMIKYDLEWLQQKTNLKKLKLESGDLFTQYWYRPTVEITWLCAGQPENDRSIIPNTVLLTLDFNLVANQKVESIQSLFNQWLKSTIPDYLDYELSFSWNADPVKYSVDNYFADRAKTLLVKSSWKPVVNIVSGFSFPILKLIQTKVTKNIVNVPLINDDSNIWILNENIDIDLIEKWINFVSLYFWK